jgi:hypothetical protein
MATPSHRLKIKRAKKHLQDLNLLTDMLRQRREYPVIESRASSPS